jgi:hypothetical protein
MPRFLAHVYARLGGITIALLLSTNCWMLACPAIAQINEALIRIPYSGPKSPEKSYYYYEEVLQLALQKTESSHGKARVEYYPYHVGRERQRALLRKGKDLQVLWSSTSREREKTLLPVRFNLLRGISDYKILLIRREDKDKFANVRDLSDLRRFKAGTGTHWQDTKVLIKNDIPLVTSWDYEPMFKMLAAKRFDYMVRGAQEIWSELEEHANQPFMAEETLLIHYPLPVYFFVNPDNKALAERLKTGLERAEKDGSLDQLFFSVPGFQRAYDEVQYKQRRLIKMESP